MKYLLPTALAAILVLLVTGPALAYGNYYCGPEATQEQAARIQQITTESRETILPLLLKIQAKQAELDALMNNPVLNKGKAALILARARYRYISPRTAKARLIPTRPRFWARF